MWRTGAVRSPGVHAVVGEARCVGCRRRAGVLCPACSADLRPADPREAPPGVDRILCALDYSGAARSLVLDLKLRGRKGAALPLADADGRSPGPVRRPGASDHLGPRASAGDQASGVRPRSGAGQSRWPARRPTRAATPRTGRRRRRPDDFVGRRTVGEPRGGLHRSTLLGARPGCRRSRDHGSNAQHVRSGTDRGRLPRGRGPHRLQCPGHY